MNPFRFYTRLNQIRLLGIKARNLKELLEGIKIVPGSSIYYHTHRFLVRHHFLETGPTNDFAYWVGEILDEQEIAEKFGSVSILEHSSIKSLRDTFIRILEENIEGKDIKDVPPEKAFHFLSCRTFILPTGYQATNIEEFKEKIKIISIHSIFFHLFEARLRLSREENDFSCWLRDLGYPEIAKEIAKLDPYTETLETIREKILKICEEKC
ncbi:MAG: hypothetical protein DRI36_03820 [Caldiserica bacterium]|nr:MAG: hypothetical protein DRI36_03820 [Caldisericota bacterium]